ncbi:hypothetical protein QVD17_39673 [Tagetes erecta]|uniref:NADH-ubiquinone oxidoreductase chain 4 n=1 Tax=Tagetes erecta TaxID=13708 RepID=A0AAD8JQZ1_TARER|nr:hypothetical protein QVD17_39673 [Tagetes erecta]
MLEEMDVDLHQEEDRKRLSTAYSILSLVGSSTISGGSLVGMFLSGSVWSNRSQLARKEYRTGFLRFSIPMFPEATLCFTPFIYTLSAIAIIYTSLTTLRQIDLKKISAYSLVAHMNLVTIGMFSLNHKSRKRPKEVSDSRYAIALLS